MTSGWSILLRFRAYPRYSLARLYAPLDSGSPPGGARSSWGHRIGPIDIGLCPARCEAGKGLLALMRGKLLRAAEPHAAILGALAALTADRAHHSRRVL